MVYTKSIEMQQSNKTMKLMGVEIIVRDNMGLVLASLYMSILYITNLTMIEAYVDWKAVIFGRDLGLQNVIMKGNALKIVHIFQTEDQSWYK
jgi:hypothetical protein